LSEKDPYPSPEEPTGGGSKNLNPNSARFIRTPRRLPSAKELVEGIRSGDRIKLGQAITLIESTKPGHRQLAQEVVETCLPFSGQALRIGITGTPGVGKSSFIEAFGKSLTTENHKIAVLAIDPSSQRSHGSILGDKTRMGALAADPLAFIRPSPAGTALGGVARQTRETMILCEAAGYEYILVETVGVGQSETAVESMTDFLLLLLLPGAGDELQGIKRGIVEMADLLAVNKADGDRIQLAKDSKRAYRNALHLFPPQESGWTPRVEICSSLDGSGIETIKEAIGEYATLTQKNGYFERKRRRQAEYWLEESLRQSWQQFFTEDPKMRTTWEEIREKVINGEWSPMRGARYLLDLLIGKRNS
jgi:LAO/AO transport system kinase